MARYFHGGKDAVDPALYAAHAVDDEGRKILVEEAAKHHPLTHPHRDALKRDGDKIKIRVPSAFCPIDSTTRQPIETLRDWEAGSITLGIHGVGFFVVPPGGYVDIDPSISEKTVKSLAPHLLTEVEAMARGLLEPAPVMRKAAADEQRGRAKAERLA